MKTLLPFLVACGSGPDVAEQHLASRRTDARLSRTPVERVIADTTTAVSVVLNQETVRCSAIGYGVSNLKVIVPALAGLSVLNHRVFSLENNLVEAGPCLTAGWCSDIDIEPFLDEEHPEEPIDLRVKQSVQLTPDESTKTCRVVLVEEVTTTIRETPFFHHASHVLHERKIDDCF